MVFSVRAMARHASPRCWSETHRRLGHLCGQSTGHARDLHRCFVPLSSLASSLSQWRAPRARRPSSSGGVRLHAFLKVNLDPEISLCLAFEATILTYTVGVCNGQLFESASHALACFQRSEAWKVLVMCVRENPDFVEFCPAVDSLNLVAHNRDLCGSPKS